MKVVVILALISFSPGFSRCSKEVKSQKFSPLSKAFVNITRKLSEYNRYAVITKSSDSEMLDSVIMKALKNESFAIAVAKANDGRYQLGDSAILTFDSVNSLKEFNTNVVLTNKYAKPLQFFVHCKSATVEEIASLEERSTILQFQYFIVENTTTIRLMTFVYYTPTTCKQLTLIEVNSFNKKYMKWISDKFHIEKFTNFFGCTLSVPIPMNYPVTMHTVIRNSEGRLIFWFYGYNVELTETLGRHLNMKLAFNPMDGNAKLYYDAKPDFRIDVFDNELFYQNYINKTFMLQPHIFTDMRVAVPPGADYSAYEKLVLPFELEVWAWIGVTFMISFLTIFIVYRFSAKVRNFIFGRNVSTPSMNVIQIMFGIGMISLPGKFTIYKTLKYPN